MAAIRLLSWNIQQYGPSKFGAAAPNSAALIATINGAITQTQANVVCLLELMSSTVHGICAALQGSLGGAWQYVSFPTGGAEFAAIFWQPANFGVLTLQNGAQAIGLVGIPYPAMNSATLAFPTNFSHQLGRRPAFIVFRTTDTNQNFVVTAYHPPPTGNAIFGLQQLATWVAALTVDRQGGAAGEAVAGRLCAGDYNLDFAANTADYQNFCNATGTIAAIPGQAGAPNAADTMLNKIQSSVVWTFPTTTIGYRQNLCIDNILANGVPGASHVPDVLQLLRVGQPLAAHGAAFAIGGTGATTFPNSDYIAQPINSPFRAFVLARYAVSDHLPVFASVTI